MAHEETEKTLESLRNTKPKEAAEYALALAVIYKRKGNNERAIQYGKEAIALLDQCPTDSLEDCAGVNILIEDVLIPGILHQQVVRNYLQPLPV